MELFKVILKLDTLELHAWSDATDAKAALSDVVRKVKPQSTLKRLTSISVQREVYPAPREKP